MTLKYLSVAIQKLSCNPKNTVCRFLIYIADVCCAECVIHNLIFLKRRETLDNNNTV